MDENPVVFVVDDDEAVREGISDLIHSMGYEVQNFASAEDFVQTYRPGRPACLLLDVRIPGMSGMELLSKLAEEKALIPTIIVTGHGDIPMAVQALKIGAVDFVEKPFREQDLWTKVKKALSSSIDFQNTQAQQMDLENKLSLLTSKEREVLRLLVAGEVDKHIANELSVSRRVVAYHRASILDKMAVTSIVELATLFARTNISP